MNCTIYMFAFCGIQTSFMKIALQYPSKVYVHRIKHLAMHAYMQCSLTNPVGLCGTPGIDFHFVHLVLHNLTLYNGVARILGLCCVHVRVSKTIIAVVEWDGDPSFD